MHLVTHTFSLQTCMHKSLLRLTIKNATPEKQLAKFIKFTLQEEVFVLRNIAAQVV